MITVNRIIHHFITALVHQISMIIYSMTPVPKSDKPRLKNALEHLLLSSVNNYHIIVSQHTNEGLNMLETSFRKITK